MLISPLNAFPWVLNGLMEAWVSVKRIQAFLSLDNLDLTGYYEQLDCSDKGESKSIVICSYFVICYYQCRSSKKKGGGGVRTRVLKGLMEAWVSVKKNPGLPPIRQPRLDWVLAATILLRQTRK